ncbi:uncharacterized protein LOC126823855 [Patella vulgata]|uniref:uncharacterized protein LOC126823855 n=1 Tax=Patella vulgata TaxID=6465 RepID=UPI0021808CE5|nr:uncharacterized protein LOC126823855 [Patella vulgata]
MVSDKKKYSVGDTACLKCNTKNDSFPLNFYDNNGNLSCQIDEYLDAAIWDRRIDSECTITSTGAELCLQAIQVKDKGTWYCNVIGHPNNATVYIDFDTNKDNRTMVKLARLTSANKPTTFEMATTTVEMANPTSMSKPTTKMTNSVNHEINCLPIHVYVIYGSLVISSISILVVIVAVILCVIKKWTRRQKDDTYQTMGDRSRESRHYYDHISTQPNLPIQTQKKRKTTLFDRLLKAFSKKLQLEIGNEYEEVRNLNKPAVVSSNPPELPKKRDVNVSLINESNGDNYLEPVVTPTLREKYKIRIGKQPIPEAQKKLSMPSCGSDSTVVQATVESRAFKGRNPASGSSSVKPQKNVEVCKHLLTRSISLPRKSTVIVI